MEILRAEEKWPSNRLNGELSRGQSSQIQRSPAATRCFASGSLASTRHASEVTQQPVRSSAEAAQEPSAICAARKNRRPRSTISPECGVFPTDCSAEIAQHVGSTRLCDSGWNPQPPSAFCAFRRNGKQKFATN